MEGRSRSDGGNKAGNSQSHIVKDFLKWDGELRSGCALTGEGKVWSELCLRKISGGGG